jgi:arylsulfatase A-like enzyme
MPAVKVRSLLMLLALSLLSSCSLPWPRSQGPNFLIIISDDQSHDTMSYMPATQAAIFDQGATFSEGLITTPLCCPSRSSILTGMFAHNDGVRTNLDKLKYPTFVNALHDHGYYTGLVGKYLNSWLGEPRPEFDFWVSFPGSVASYENPNLNVNGQWAIHKGYITYLLGDYALQFLDQAARQSEPFALIYAVRAPHDPALPAPEDRQSLLNLPPYRPPSFNQADVSNMPSSISSLPLLTAAQIAANDDFRRKQLLNLMELDRTIGDIVSKLKATGQLDNTMIIYLSDNGLQWGEHRLTSDKNSEYEESVRVPFGLRYPPLVPKPYVENRIVANIDIAPTIYQLAGLPIPANVDGTSLVQLFQGGPWRDHILLEGWPERGYWAGIHTQRYAYFETQDDSSELYDLQTDPFQLHNLIGDSAYQTFIAGLKVQLAAEKQPRASP